MKTNAGGEQVGGVEVRAAKEMTKAQSYAASLIELAKGEGVLDAVDEDLRLVNDTIAKHMKLKSTLAETEIPVEQRQKVIDEVFGGRIGGVTLNFLVLLSGMGQVELLPQIADEFARRLEAVEKKVIAEVTTAIPLAPEMEIAVGERLAALVGREVTIRSKVDPTIVGGIVVRMGGKLLDGSVRNQLDRLRNTMMIDLRAAKE